MKRCKDVIIHIFRQIKTYLVPVKGRGTIGMYQNIIVVSLWIEAVSICIALLMCMLGSDNKWATFCQNTAIGIFCSAMLILVTTVIQFTNERNKIFAISCDNIVLFVACLADSLSDKERLTKQQCEIKCKRIQKTIDNSDTIVDGDLFWFNVRINDLYLEVCCDIVKLKIPFIIDRDKVDTVRSIDEKLVMRIVTNMKKMVEKHYGMYTEIFTELEKIITEERH